MSRFLPRCLVAVLLAVIAVGSAGPTVFGDEPKRVALLVGINEYDSSAFPKLAYAEKDVEALSTGLERIGFRTMVMKGSAKRRWHATRANVLKQVNVLSEGLGKDDVLLVALLGHGVQKDEDNNGGPPASESYFCPVDAEPQDPKRMISVRELVHETLPPRIGYRIVLVDAGPRSDEGKDAAFGLQGKSLPLPANTCVFYGSRAGEESHEREELEHGLFAHCLLDGLKGGTAKNPLTWSRLQEHVVELMGSPRMAKYLPAGHRQTPLALSTLDRLVLADSPEAAPKQLFSRTTGMKFVLIPKGEYLRGSPDSDDMSEMGERNEKPQHRVRISKDFYLGQYEVTQAEWKAVMETEPWKIDPAAKEGSDYPAGGIRWDDAREFCRKLSTRDGELCRLPTEAEWELAARGGVATRYSFGDDPEQLDDYAWYSKNATAAGEKYAHRVGQKKPNPFGLYDTMGNVWEWCEDLYRPKEYANYEGKLALDPAGPSGKAGSRVIRGGGFFNSQVFARMGYRGFIPVQTHGSGFGFRVLVER